MIRKRTTRSAGQKGASLLETALMIVVIFSVVFWIFELCWVMYTYTVMSDAANEGVRYAIVHSGCDISGTTTRVQTFAATSMHNTSGMTVVVDCPDPTPPNKVSVTVTYPYVPYLSNFITAPTMKVYAEGRMVVP